MSSSHSRPEGVPRSPSPEVGADFVQSAHLTVDSVPDIPLPIDDNNLSDDHKNLLRALMINQHNLINNCEFLHSRVMEAFQIISSLAERLEARENDDDDDESSEEAGCTYPAS